MNYYTALVFSERPDLHMTLAYYRGMCAGQLDALEAIVEEAIKRLQPRAFTLECDWIGWFGPNHSIRALQPDARFEMPPWAVEMAAPQWMPHITCLEDSLSLRVDGLAIMHKRERIKVWQLI